MISVLILTLNEEQNLPRCLASVDWSDDVLVVDSFSTDRTVEIARQSGARVLQRRFDDFANQRNYGLQHGDLKHDWVLHLDADEVVTAPLRDELLKVICSPEKDAFRLASKMIFQDRWLKHSGMYPTYQVRLGRKDKLTFVQVGHGQRETLSPERIGILREALLHYSFSKGMDDWTTRHIRYAKAEAAHFVNQLSGKSVDWRGLFCWNDIVRRRRALKHFAFHLPARPALRFLYMYCWRKGFLDGRAGFEYCRLLSDYERMITANIRELRNRQQ